MSESDAQALRAACERVKCGDRAAFGVIVRYTSPRLLRLAARILGDLHDAEDVLQESYLRAFDALLLGQFEERAELATWLYRIVANAAMDALRARRRRPALAFTAASLSTGDSTRMEACAALKQLDQWLRGLPHNQRTALILKEMEGLTTAEIAATLSISPGAAEQLLVRARSALRKQRGETDA
jgi:RNA polymerase sigma-70 factor (ECF subfamily)